MTSTPDPIGELAALAADVLDDRCSAVTTALPDDPATVLRPMVEAILAEAAAQQWVEQQLAETGLRATDFRNGMTMELQPARDMVAHWVGAARAMLGDAPNYSETPVEMVVKVAEEPQQYAFTLQRVGRLTPHQARQQAEARVAELTAELAQVRRLVDRLAAHAVGFGDVLFDSDITPWGRTVGADITELKAALAATPHPARGDRLMPSTPTPAETLRAAAALLRDAHLQGGMTATPAGAALVRARLPIAQWLEASAEYCTPGPAYPTHVAHALIVARQILGEAEAVVAAQPEAVPDADLRDRIARAMALRDGHPEWPVQYEDDERAYYRRADAVLAVLPVAADRAAVLREGAALLDQRATGIDAFSSSDFGEEGLAVRELAAAADDFRRLADEAQQPTGPVIHLPAGTNAEEPTS